VKVLGVTIQLYCSIFFLFIYSEVQ